jgi:hypothetical protein
MSSRTASLLLLAGSTLLWGLSGPTAALGYEHYDEGELGCRPCHPGFQSQGPLHQLHVGSSRMTNNCLLCHESPGDNPATAHSGDPAGQGCRGCHGVDNGTAFLWATGLRRHHRDAGAPPDAFGFVCATCHPDDPEPSPESTVPVYFLRSDVHIDDPCSSQQPGGEDWDGDGQGLDNDGDLLYDEMDPDCGATGIEERPAPRATAGFEIRPNPATDGRARIRFELPAPSEVSISVHDMAGRRISSRTLGPLSRGEHAWFFEGRGQDGRPLASGIYTIRIAFGGTVLTGRVILTR